MSKLNILVVPGDRSGSGKFRCVDPHINLQNNFSSEFFVDIDYNVDFKNEQFLKKYDIIFIHGGIPNHDHVNAIEILNNIKKLGIKIIVDIDDYWHLDYSHGAYYSSKITKLADIIIQCIKLADLVITTTNILAEELRKINKNVVVLPNAINPNEEQFKPKPTTSDMVRFGWLGGSSHVKDLEKLTNFGSMQESFSKKTQIVLCGFDTRGYVNTHDPKTGEVIKRKMEPQETTWFIYECFLTNNFKNLANDPNYLKYLMQFDDNQNYDTKNKIYRRIWTKPITQYATGYNNFDVALAPLDDIKFNMYKSQLKVIEAGFHKKALIAQNYGPYTIDLVNAIGKNGEINPNGNALLVDCNKNHKNWFKYAKKLVDNPNLIKDLGERLYETVKDKYNIDNVTKDRAEIYKNIK